ncbi:DUF4269 domain-containing protein [Halobacillus amylolyticus]
MPLSYIGIDLEKSDLDIIMEVTDLKLFEKKLNNLYGNKTSFPKERL